jgi:hypothetical protein
MATVACPGCGLPRAEAEMGTKPCPVCAAVPPQTRTGGSRPPLAKTEPDPTEGLPADVSELNSPGTRPHTRAANGKPRHTSNQPPSPEGGSRVLLVGVVTFVLGAICGVGGVLGFQAIEWPKPKREESEVAHKPQDETSPSPTPQPIAIVPMPHEGGIAPIIIDPDSETDFQLPIPLPPPGVVVTHTINKPEGVYSIPPMKKGEHIVLRGTVKTLHVHALEDGAMLDASGLEAAIIIVTGKIDERSTLKLNTQPKGTVHISSKVDGKSTLEINAPEGEVRFMLTTTNAREGSKIDNGSRVTIAARTVEFKGDITGADTKVAVTLSRNAWLKITAIGGTAIVEYKSQVAGWSPPDVIVGTVAGTATFRKIE